MRQRSTLQTCLLGCLIVFVVLAVLSVIVGLWIRNNWRGLVADFGSQAIKQGIDQTQLPPQEKQDINIQIDRLAEAFRTGQLSAEKLQRFVKKLAKSPLMTSIAASAIEVQYLAKSGLSKDEKAQATQTLRRFLRGVVDQKIDEDAVNTAMSHVAVRDENDSWKLKQKVSDEDLRKFLDVAKAAADKAGIPDEPEDFDPSDEMKRIVDEALQP